MIAERWVCTSSLLHIELKMMKNRRTASVKSVPTKAPAEQVAKYIRRTTRKLHSAEERIWIVLSGRRGEVSIA